MSESYTTTVVDTQKLNELIHVQRMQIEHLQNELTLLELQQKIKNHKDNYGTQE